MFARFFFGGKRYTYVGEFLALVLVRGLERTFEAAMPMVLTALRSSLTRHTQDAPGKKLADERCRWLCIQASLDLSSWPASAFALIN